MFYDMAYDGHWRETLEFIAHAYKENSSVRSAIEGERNLQEAVEQIKRYAVGPRVLQLIQGTELHLIIMQFRGCELERMEEV